MSLQHGSLQRKLWSIHTLMMWRKNIFESFKYWYQIGVLGPELSSFMVFGVLVCKLLPSSIAIDGVGSWWCMTEVGLSNICDVFSLSDRSGETKTFSGMLTCMTWFSNTLACMGLIFVSIFHEACYWRTKVILEDDIKRVQQWNKLEAVKFLRWSSSKQQGPVYI